MMAMVMAMTMVNGFAMAMVMVADT